MQCKVPNTSLPTYYHAARPGVFNDSQVFSWALNYDITTFAHGRDWKWKFIGWKRESTGPRAGQLGFIAEDPTNGERWFCGVCPYSRAYRRIHLMPVKQQVLLPVRRRPMLLGFFR